MEVKKNMAYSDKPQAFKVQQRLISFLRATYDIFDADTGEKLYIAQKKIFSWGPTIIIKDLHDQEVAIIKGNVLFANKWKVIQQGVVTATITFPLIKLFRTKFTVRIENKEYKAASLFGYGFEASDDEGNIGFTLNKKVFSLRDTYKIEVFPPVPPLTGLATALTIDYKFYQGK